MRDENLPVPKTFDHWWPRGIQRLWTDSLGYVGSIDQAGKIVKKKPEKTKKSKKTHAGEFEGHRIELNGPWTHSYEGLFENIDNDAPKMLIELSAQLANIDFRPKTIWRFLGLSQRHFWTTIRTVASLQIRSPKFRAKNGHIHAGFGGGWSDDLAKVNMQSAIRCVEECIDAKSFSPTLFFLRSTGSEFIFGDGSIDHAFSDFRSLRLQGDKWVANFQGLSIISLTPLLAVVVLVAPNDWSEGLQACHIVDLSESSVAEINAILFETFDKVCFFRSLPENPPRPWSEMGGFGTPDLSKIEVVLQCFSAARRQV